MNINEKSKFKHLTAFILVILVEQPRNPRDIHSILLQDFPGFTIDMSTVYRCLSSLEKEGLVTIKSLRSLLCQGSDEIIYPKLRIGEEPAKRLSVCRLAR